MDPLCLYIQFCKQLQTITTKQLQIKFLENHPCQYQEKLSFFPSLLTQFDRIIDYTSFPLCHTEINAATT